MIANKKLKPSKNRAGYSDFRMWPCYLAGTTIMFVLAPFIGMFWAVIIGLAAMAKLIHFLVVLRPLTYDSRQELYVTCKELIHQNRQMYHNSYKALLRLTLRAAKAS